MRTSLPKYVQLSQWIKDKIVEDGLLKGDKFYTEHKLSEIFSVSRQTVRQAINLLITENILESRQGSGTYISAQMTAKKTSSKSIGVIVTYFDEYIFPSIIQGIESIISGNGYTMHLACTHNNTEVEAKTLRSMLDNDVDGFIIEPTKSGLPTANKELYNEIFKKNIPLVFLNSYYKDMDFAYIALDDIKAGYTAASCLFDFGHKKISLALKADDMQGHLRYSGAIAAANERNIIISSENIFWFTTEDIKYLDEDFKRMQRYIKDSTALMCYNDKIASTIIEMLKSNGYSLPEGMSVIGIDDASQAKFCSPQLTTIAHPKKLLGVVAAQTIFKMIAGEKIIAPIKFEPKLILRESVTALQE